MRRKVRPTFPERAVVTAGMPYGNKELHFGHIGGVFIQADTFARFLRDRIGYENVLFVSGTDCYGSPIVASYERDIGTEDNHMSISDYVMSYHMKQKETLGHYDIEPNLYGTSAFGVSGDIHRELSKSIARSLYDMKYLRIMRTKQFFDKAKGVFLNGRQVIGSCPYDGCKSSKAYADECENGHQYLPSDLINPISILSNTTPVLLDADNWYFDLESFHDVLEHKTHLDMDRGISRPVVNRSIMEFLKPPMLYITRREYSKLGELNIDLDSAEIVDLDKKPSITLVFNSLEDRDNLRSILDNESIKYRSGKTLVPFRLSGNLDWGVPFPSIEGYGGLSFWVWPESLWAPISFTKAYLRSINKDEMEWEYWWFGENSSVYQFIGEDNIYFYGVAEMAMLYALLGKEGLIDESLSNIRFPELVANHHLLYMDSKASSSGTLKPPLACELLDYYTKDQLRMHFLSLGLGKKSVSFNPLYLKDGEEKKDAVLKDGNLLTNVFNRILRSCFYTSQRYYDSRIPMVELNSNLVKTIDEAVLTYEDYMAKKEFHRVIYCLDKIIRDLNKYWVRSMREADSNDDDGLRKQVLATTIYAVKNLLILLHPITPSSAELVSDYLNLDRSLWSWASIFEPLSYYIDDISTHRMKKIEPRFDFYKKHLNQLS